MIIETADEREAAENLFSEEEASFIASWKEEYDISEEISDEQVSLCEEMESRGLVTEVRENEEEDTTCWQPSNLGKIAYAAYTAAHSLP